MAYTLEMLAIEHEKARIRYVPRPYSGPVVLFRASKQLSGLMTDYTLGWKDVLNGNFEICEVPGHQETMLSDPNVSILAEKVTPSFMPLRNGLLAAHLAADSLYSVQANYTSLMSVAVMKNFPPKCANAKVGVLRFMLVTVIRSMQKE